MTNPVRKLTQTGNSQPNSDAIDLPYTKRPEPEIILDAFFLALENVTESSLVDAAQGLAADIKRTLPLATPADSFLVHFDLLLTRIAKIIPNRHIGQELLVTTVTQLTLSPEPQWFTRFPYVLGWTMRDHWIGKLLCSCSLKPEYLHHLLIHIQKALPSRRGKTRTTS